MIGVLLDILEIDDFEGVSEEVDIAKGKYKLPTSFREGWKQHKRKWHKK